MISFEEKVKPLYSGQILIADTVSRSRLVSATERFHCISFVTVSHFKAESYHPALVHKLVHGL